MRIRQLWLCLSAALVGLVGFTGLAKADTILVNPRATYLRTNSDPSALDAVAINLSTLSFTVTPGDFIRLERMGDYSAGSSLPDTQTWMVGVFSSSNVLLGSSNLNRVAGAIDAGTDVTTSPTFFGSLSTDIAQDFKISDPVGVPGGISSIIVEVPTGAAYLFVSPNDSFFGDNTDPNGNYGVQITSVARAIPEPSSLALLALGGLGLLGYGGRRRKRGA